MFSFPIVAHVILHAAMYYTIEASSFVSLAVFLQCV